ncbi:MAG: hypothetical protein DPW09_05620 [Anaerolineae bacterium]|nr:type II toxin-antitoxin system HicB family antitoxin [Anaerolineales bacterium]MCQ3972914.1 hypothetical protein [Anaerolineae bacterium]
MRYPVVIHKDPQSDYGVSMPDLPGCFSAGETLDEALTQVVEAIECHLEGILADGEPIPPPQEIEVHQAKVFHRSFVRQAPLGSDHNQGV